jgi:GMP synthase (glutamine-hydrolysing)
VARILVFQHVPYEPLGTLDPLIRHRRHRIRYINFGRDPQATPEVAGYDALVVLGGPMNVDQQADYPHLGVEIACIRQAVEAGKPVLGICLGAQLLAAAAGAVVKPASVTEIGWHSVYVADQAREDRLFAHFERQEQVFQWHSYTFDLPAQAQGLAAGKAVANQAFRLGKQAWGLQFHLEVNAPLARRWVNLPAHQGELAAHGPDGGAEQVHLDTERYLPRSEALSRRVFGAFLDTLGQPAQRLVLGSRHP